MPRFAERLGYRLAVLPLLFCATAITAIAQGGMPTSVGLPGAIAANLPTTAVPRGILVFTQAVPRLVVGKRFKLSVGSLRGNALVPLTDSVTWQSSAPDVIAVSGEGVAQGLKEGSAFVTATSIDGQVKLRITVVKPAFRDLVASLDVSPDSENVEVGASVQLRGIPRAANGTIVPTVAVDWVSLDTSVAVVTTDGLLRARAAGRSRIVASIGKVSRVAIIQTTRPQIARLVITPSASSLKPGDSARVAVAALRADGSRVDGAEMMVTARTGRMRGSVYVAPSEVALDTIFVRTPDGVWASAAVSILGQAAVTGSGDSRSIVLRLVRFDGGTGPVLVSSGIPLAPGQLRAADAAQTKFVVNGVEVAANISPLRGTHKDGSLRAILVQAIVPIGSASVPAELLLGVAPSVARMTARPTESQPIAMALPNTSQLIASRIVGPTVPIDSTSLQNFDRLFQVNADLQWTATGADWSAANYYDRVLNHVAYWVRGGSATYMRRALSIAIDYREKYLVANQYGSSPHWAQLEGLAIHYWLTGDEASRQAVLKTTDRLTPAFTASNLSKADYEWLDGRIQARLLLANSLSSALDGGSSYAASASAYAGAIVATTHEDGSHSWPAFCGLQANYMAALQNDALIKYSEFVGTDTRVPAVMKRSLDYLWRTQWNQAGQAFRYVSAPCATVGEAELAPDLNMLFVSGFAWYANQTRDATYRLHADEIALGGIAKAWIAPTKQFNQFYYDSFNYLSYRRF